MSIKLTGVPPNMLPCPKCGCLTLDFGIRPRTTAKRITWMGMPALDVKIERLPVIWCAVPWCGFEQWGTIVDGMYAEFGGGENGPAGDRG